MIGKYWMLHPYGKLNEFEDRWIEVNFRGQTVNGVPQGDCFLSYYGHRKIFNNFEGYGKMMNGELHGGGACFETINNYRYSFSNMVHGRPQGQMISYNYDDYVSRV